MTWEVGVCAVADNEVVTKSGQAGALYEAATAEADPLPSLTPPSDWPRTESAWLDQIRPVRLTILRERAKMCRWLAAGIVAHAKANAVITCTVTTSDSGLQRDPGPPNPNTLAPSSDKDISGTIS